MMLIVCKQEGSFLCSQEAATTPLMNLTSFVQKLIHCFFKISFNITFHLPLGHARSLQVFLQIFCRPSCSSPCVLHVHLSSQSLDHLDNIWRRMKIMMILSVLHSRTQISQSAFNVRDQISYLHRTV